MSILTSASSNSVSRGYDYYKHHKVHNVYQINENEYEAYVDGSLKDPYYVKINIEHPRKSECDCPFANGNRTCKHMIALYFDLFPEEVDDYESWLNSDYEEDYDEDYEDYDDYYDEDDDFEKPLFFNVVLDNYIESLSKEELQKLLKEELLKHEEDTYYTYLEKDYKNFLRKSGKSLSYLNNLNKIIKEYTNIYFSEYNYRKFDEIILKQSDKRKIWELYDNKEYRKIIDDILLIPELAVYDKYDWVANFYRENKKQEELEKFISDLNYYLNSLKHYSIKNNIPKSNILITIFLLKKYSIKELAESLLNNAKYSKYIEYVIENTYDFNLLYKEFIKLINKNYYKNKMYIPNVLLKFWFYSDYNKDISFDYNLFGFLCLGDIEYLKYLNIDLPKEEIIKCVEEKTSNINLLAKLYNFFNEDEKLYNLISNKNQKYLFSQYIELLKNNYSDKLYDYFYNEFNIVLTEGKKREVYHRASQYIRAISKLNNGQELVNNIINNLKMSNYNKCTALFEEIETALNN